MDTPAEHFSLSEPRNSLQLVSLPLRNIHLSGCVCVEIGTLTQLCHHFHTSDLVWTLHDCVTDGVSGPIVLLILHPEGTFTQVLDTF